MYWNHIYSAYLLFALRYSRGTKHHLRPNVRWKEEKGKTPIETEQQKKVEANENRKKAKLNSTCKI
jgi:hypothetical protein